MDDDLHLDVDRPVLIPKLLVVQRGAANDLAVLRRALVYAIVERVRVHKVHVA